MAGASGVVNVGGSEVLGRYDFALEVCGALNQARSVGARLDVALLNSVTTSNAGQAAKRPLSSGLDLSKLSTLLPGWKPRTVKQAIAHWVGAPRGKALGE